MNFCTLFDSGYLQRGLALYDSLCNTCDDFHLYVMAFDDKSYDILSKLNLPFITVVHLRDFEDERLLEVKPSRTKAEYCWTCGPSVIYYFIKTYNLNSCCYLDADLMFYRSPQILFDEIGDNSVAITEHFSPYDVPAGKYCVQFMYFKNDEWGMKALKWWRDKCIEWCYSYFEDGKYGDQKYLEEFPRLFQKVYVVQNRGAGIASWNLKEYEYDASNWTINYLGKVYDIVFVHFHAVSMEVMNNTIILTPATFDITKNSKFIFEYYARIILNVCNSYLNLDLSKFEIRKRQLNRRLFSKLKLLLRDIKPVRFVYEKFFRPEYKGYDKKNLI